MILLFLINKFTDDESNKIFRFCGEYGILLNDNNYVYVDNMVLVIIKIMMVADIINNIILIIIFLIDFVLLFMVIINISRLILYDDNLKIEQLG